ncbi:uncharacterized protein C8A04DRAFT_25877 [Dichotomopilus funicola]|uniref:Uncharacterized protein n=1 Tax=Dichotomopilus funicola TaxID=1934379 RepID=A0AAN6V7X1_9PEZI|nr:hypothetical protein C8A04DRAFT_25877 [Dichotomopilus funicola]
MHLTTAFTILTSTAASVSAAALTPKGTAAEATDGKFNLRALRPGGPIDMKFINASKDKLWLSLPEDKHDEQCNGGELTAGAAVLFVQDQQLFLYGGETDSHQQVAIDLSPEGHGRLLYFNELNGKPNPRAEIYGWSTPSDGQLLASQYGNFLACAEDDGTYSVYVTRETPGADLKCFQFDATAVSQSNAVPCTYSSEV